MKRYMMETLPSQVGSKVQCLTDPFSFSSAEVSASLDASHVSLSHENQKEALPVSDPLEVSPLELGPCAGGQSHTSYLQMSKR